MVLKRSKKKDVISLKVSNGSQVEIVVKRRKTLIKINKNPPPKILACNNFVTLELKQKSYMSNSFFSK